jgi:hypothetical protein
MNTNALWESLQNSLGAHLPQLFGALAIFVLGWVVAVLVRAVVRRSPGFMGVSHRFGKLTGQRVDIESAVAIGLFWVVILLFVPAVLGALEMDGLLDPLRAMIAKSLDMLPNAVAALVIGGIGWIVGTVLRNLVTNLSRTAGVDKLGDQAGMAPSVRISSVLGLLVFAVVFLPSLIAALDALKIEAISLPATAMLAMLLAGVPHLIAAVLILVIAWLVASFAARRLTSVLSALGFDRLPAQVGLTHAFEHTPASVVVGRVALFFAMLFASLEAASQLGFAQVSGIVGNFIQFGGDLLLGAILIIGFWLANVAYDAIDRASGAQSQGLARIGRFAIPALVLAMGLRAMGIADDIVNLAFGLALGAIAVAVALSFGLGGRATAGQLMDHWLARLRRED